ncbi:RluA family pseudouridine synthase [Myxococcota bacterium]|nr:RluA family pseudouridine synthase [Myxococcota bacterium]MBU1900544.1 RluA family pseudouridine synthase [Myxococcota bacterium]
MVVDHEVYLSVPPEEEGARLDLFLVRAFAGKTRSQLAGWLKEGRVTLGGRATRASLKLRGGEALIVRVPAPPTGTLEPQPMPLEIVYEDEAILVINKPAGLVVHPGTGNPDGTLVNGLLAYGPLSPIGLPDRPGIVHRIDAGTSGLLIVARTEAAHIHLADQLRAHTVERRYLAIAWDHGLAPEGTLDTPYSRHPNDRRKFTGRVFPNRAAPEKRAVTHWRVLESLYPCAFVELRLETGRTHQIRVHLSEAGHPLVGDPMYGQRRRIEQPSLRRQMGFELGLARQALHAATLGFIHPMTGERLRFEAPLPEDFSQALLGLKRTS